MRSILLSCCWLLLSACSHMKSGQHVYRAGRWVFVPSNVGILTYLRDTVAVEDYSQLGKGDFAWPVPKVRKVSSGFGKRWGKNHEGIDIPAPIGTAVVAVKEGKITYSDDRISGYGEMLIIEHGPQIFSVYAHLDERLVKKGQRVKRGQLIAKTGNTGRSSGPHLHFEIRIKNQPRDPARYLGFRQ